MQSILISGNPKDTDVYVLKICEENKVSNFDVNFLKDEKLGIEQIRNMQKRVFLKPFKSKIKISVIQNAEKLTTEAQNALLKVLEEPPSDTIIILTTTNKEHLLATILSRCKIVELKKETSKLSENEILNCQSVLKLLSEGETGDRLKIAQDFSKTKEDALNFIENLIILVRKNLIDEASNRNLSNALISQYLNILISFQKTHTIIYTTNISARLALENLFLGVN
ncbi:MAG: DNA polymerase III subunit [Patescibacteria group bacterium]|nr:DNA polymerase III subunit [Patescibacteria group bacterium]